MAKERDPSAECCKCPIYCLIEHLSKKWVMHILRELTDHKKLRFCEIIEELPEINSRILSERLSELEAEGLVRRTIQDTKPVCVHYEITEKGMDLKKIFDTFGTWHEKWGERPVAA